MNYVFFLKKLAAIHNADLTSSGFSLSALPGKIDLLSNPSQKTLNIFLQVFFLHDIMDLDKKLVSNFIGKVYCSFLKSQKKSTFLDAFGRWNRPWRS